VLARGYAVVQQQDTRAVVRSVEQVRAGDALEVHVSDGVFPATAGAPKKR
jgi:exonuclease VII large subunit